MEEDHYGRRVSWSGFLSNPNLNQDSLPSSFHTNYGTVTGEKCKTPSVVVSSLPRKRESSMVNGGCWPVDSRFRGNDG